MSERDPSARAAQLEAMKARKEESKKRVDPIALSRTVSPSHPLFREMTGMGPKKFAKYKQELREKNNAAKETKPLQDTLQAALQSLALDLNLPTEDKDAIISQFATMLSEDLYAGPLKTVIKNELGDNPSQEAMIERIKQYLMMDGTKTPDGKSLFEQFATYLTQS